MRTLRAIGLGFAAAFGAGAACSPEVETAPAPGELMVAVQTDMSLPKDVDKIRIEVLSYGSLQFGNDYDVGPGGLKVPATIGILEGEDPSTPVTIRVIARQAGKARMLREVVTTVPDDRLATLRIPIQWLCDGNAKETSPVQVEEGKCPPEQTCVAGSCADWTIDSALLPDYSPADVFGGGTGVGDGTCFDTVACLRGGAVVVPDAACTIPAPGDLSKLNLGLSMPAGGDGICDDSETTCFIPLDGASDVGWSEGRGEAAGRVQLVPAVCEKLADGSALALVASDGCATKTASIPTCGPWSSVTPDAVEPTCGDGRCDEGESCGDCAADCGACTGTCVGCDGGTCDGNVCTITTGAGGTQQLLLSGDSLYWLDAGGGAILQSALVPTGEPTTFFSAPTGAVITSFALGSLYWTEASELWLDHLDGSASTSFSVGTNLRGLTRDATKGYFLRDECDGGTPCESSAIVCFYLGELGSDYVLASNQANPKALTSDGTSLFWLNGGTASSGFGDGAVMSLSIFGDPSPMVKEAEVPSPRDLAFDAKNLYYSLGDGEIHRVPLGGGQPSSLSSSPPADEIAVAGGWVYFTSTASQTISRVPTGGGPVETVAPTGGAPTSLASDGTSVFWSTTEGAIKKVTPVTEPPDAGTGDASLQNCGLYYDELSQLVGAACGSCMTSGCCDEGIACLGDAACVAFTQCWAACGATASCIASCSEQAGGVVPLTFSAVASCRDSQCAADCSSPTDAGTDGGVCHDECTTGPYMNPGCSTCAGLICTDDPYCCQTSWDAQCVEEVGTICGQSCGDGGACVSCAMQLVQPVPAPTYCPGSDTVHIALTGCACSAPCMAACEMTICAGEIPPDQQCFTCLQTSCPNELVACQTDAP